MDILEEIKNEYLFILGYGKDDFKQTILSFQYNKQDDTFTITQDSNSPVIDKYQIIGDSVQFTDWTISKDNQEYKILVHENQTSYHLMKDFEIKLVW